MMAVEMEWKPVGSEYESSERKLMKDTDETRRRKKHKKYEEWTNDEGKVVIKSISTNIVHHFH